MTHRIMTLHPDSSKTGVNIDQQKYVTMRSAIQQSLEPYSELTFTELTEHVQSKLQGRFDGSIRWYMNVVKLDLEARGILVRVSKSSPLRLRWLGADEAKL